MLKSNKRDTPITSESHLIHPLQVIPTQNILTNPSATQIAPTYQPHPFVCSLKRLLLSEIQQTTPNPTPKHQNTRAAHLCYTESPTTSSDMCSFSQQTSAQRRSQQSGPMAHCHPAAAAGRQLERHGSSGLGSGRQCRCGGSDVPRFSDV